jgi:serine/threonine-protein kinase
MAITGTSDQLFLAFQQALAGRYSIVRELGRGGMGVVYLAREVHLDRLVAIKVLPPEKAHRLRQGFLREARFAAKLSHPHVIPIHAVDDVGGFVFYVMSFVEGETLAERVRKRGPLSAGEGVRLLREVTWALAYAHAQGVVHRDVKPDNILLEASTGRALVADFGIAAVAGDSTVGSVAGTPEFMSPEQARGGEVDARSDIYSLGVTAFYAFSGRVPFEGGSAMEVLARHASEAPPSLAWLGLALPRRLSALVDRCLAKDPAARPVSAASLADEMGLTLEQRRQLPVALRAFVRRNGRMAGGGTLLYASTLLVVSSAIASTLGEGAAVATLLSGLAVAPLGFSVLAARRLMRLGFAHADLGPAFRQELESTREERAIDQGPTDRRVDRIVAAVTRMCASYCALALPVLSIVLTFPGGRARVLSVLPVTLVLLGIGLVAGAAHLTSLQRRRDIDTEVWAALWRGRIGALAFSVARRFGGEVLPAAAMTHRPTELALGMAAEQLYDSLPKETRRALGDVPGVLARLQRDARTLRSFMEALDAAPGLPEGLPPLYESMRVEREMVGERLAHVVAALETIRLNLLRLHADSSALPGITTHIAVAEEMSREVERLLSAGSDVDASLRFPRSLEPTPV